MRDQGPHLERLNRVNIISLACRNGHVGCLKEAGKIFKDWIRDENKYISPNLRALAYKYGMQSVGDANDWQTVLERYVKESNAQEKSKLLYGLAFNTKPWVLTQFIRLAQNESIVRSQDFLTALRYVSKNPIGTPIVWEFVRREWNWLVDRYTLNSRQLGRTPKYITESFNSQFQLEEVKAFFAKNSEAGAGKFYVTVDAS